MSQAPFNLLPINSVMERYAPPQSQLGNIEPEQQLAQLDPIAPILQTMPEQFPQGVMTNVPPIQLGATSPAQQQPSVYPSQDQMANLQKQIAGYQTFGQKHPIAGSIFGYTTPKDEANLANLERQANAMQSIHEAQQATATNQWHTDTVKQIASQFGVPEPPPNAQINFKDMLEYVQNTGQTDLLRKYAHYNAELNLKAQHDRLAFDDFAQDKAAGKLTPEEIKAGPKYLAAPEPPESLNPFIKATDISGALESGNTAAKNGADMVGDAQKNITSEQDAKARLEETKVQHGFQKQAHEDAMAQQDAIRQQGESHFQAEQGSKMQGYLAGEAKTANEEARRGMDRVLTLNHQLQDLVSKTPKDKIRTDPRYIQLNSEYRKAQESYGGLKATADEKKARADRYVGSQEEAPVSNPTPPASQPVRQSGSQKPMKIRMTRAEAEAAGLIPKKAGLR